MPNLIEINKRTITDPTAMSNVYRSYINKNTFSLTSTDKNEIYFIIYSLDSHKSSDPNIIPQKTTEK